MSDIYGPRVPSPTQRFYIERGAIGGFAGLVGRAVDDMEASSRYFRENAKDVSGGELIGITRPSHNRLKNSIPGTLDRFAKTIDLSQQELIRTDKHYDQSDKTAAANLDGTLPQLICHKETEAEKDYHKEIKSSYSFDDVRDPVGRLKKVPAAEKPTNPFDLMDLASPSAWALEAFNAIFGFNPLDVIQNKVWGNWQELAEMEPTLHNMSKAMQDIAFNINHGVGRLKSAWKGNAADAAHNYFIEMENAVLKLQKPLDEAAQAYKDLAEALLGITESLCGLAKGLLDQAIVVGISAAAGTVTAETGVGAVVGYGIAGLEIANMLATWGRITKLLSNALNAVYAFAGIISGVCGTIESHTISDLPGSGAAYDHPLVSP